MLLADVGKEPLKHIPAVLGFCLTNDRFIGMLGNITCKCSFSFDNPRVSAATGVLNCCCTLGVPAISVVPWL